MHPFTSTTPPRLALLLGYSGLLPFIGGALGVWVTPLGWRSLVLYALLDYAAVILAFMGAIHWGLAMREERNASAAQQQVALSVVPALFGWLAVASGLPALLSVPLLMLAFALLYFADLRAVHLGLAPAWYPALRKPLTLVVLLCLAVTWSAL
ncbi:DUF3429 domain-containing protein [Pseudomonas sp. HAR-UPW-AIA-41]|uniref:DUF3429 domain-containing protein n=1 Tax=Pseudomonas sp. HAR-UPW-AIA-41 TaxID=1985301 RepID=UPI000BB30D26|nr:DUF3429 domain-containing protein [Pseudomonas sp. HAR-UPW-AIA-41]PAV47572.1 DUF3429 domain-containing protein [Pseudomonas sp. HAR-UPW-AIA-41]